MRKKHWVGALQERFDALSKDNERLRVEERALAAEVALMRGLLEEWRGCAVVARESM